MIAQLIIEAISDISSVLLVLGAIGIWSLF